MFKFINIKIFLISLFVGLFFVYLSAPPVNVIFVYPTPENIDSVQYKDKADNCFTFDAMEITCPDNKNSIKKIPIQE